MWYMRYDFQCLPIITFNITSHGMLGLGLGLGTFINDKTSYVISDGI